MKLTTSIDMGGYEYDCDGIYYSCDSWRIESDTYPLITVQIYRDREETETAYLWDITAYAEYFDIPTGCTYTLASAGCKFADGSDLSTMLKAIVKDLRMATNDARKKADPCDVRACCRALAIMDEWARTF